MTSPVQSSERPSNAVRTVTSSAKVEATEQRLELMVTRRFAREHAKQEIDLRLRDGAGRRARGRPRGLRVLMSAR